MKLVDLLVSCGACFVAVLAGAWAADVVPAPAMETSEVKRWQLNEPAIDWITRDDTDTNTPQLVLINRTGERIDSIEVWPPVGVSVTIHRNGKPDVVLLNKPEVERATTGHGR